MALVDLHAMRRKSCWHNKLYLHIVYTNNVPFCKNTKLMFYKQILAVANTRVHLLIWLSYFRYADAARKITVLKQLIKLIYSNRLECTEVLLFIITSRIIFDILYIVCCHWECGDTTHILKLNRCKTFTNYKICILFIS